MHVFQVGAGSGGMAVLDLVARDARVTRVTLVEPDVYKPHNVYRHLFPPSAVGRLKAELAAEWVRAIRPDLTIEAIVADLTDPARHADFARAAGKPWTLGEVLSGGIGGWVHRFAPGGPCYGCVASYLQREVTEQPAGPPPDYSNPNAAQPEATVPASKASIAVIAGLHANVTLHEGLGARGEGAEEGQHEQPSSTPSPLPPNPSDITSLVFSLQVVPGVFDAAYRAHRLRIARSPTCLTCGTPAPVPTGEALDAAVDDALARLGAR
jgi:hypothetical protein